MYRELLEEGSTVYQTCLVSSDYSKSWKLGSLPCCYSQKTKCRMEAPSLPKFLRGRNAGKESSWGDGKK